MLGAFSRRLNLWNWTMGRTFPGLVKCYVIWWYYELPPCTWRQNASRLIYVMYAGIDSSTRRCRRESTPTVRGHTTCRIHVFPTRFPSLQTTHDMPTFPAKTPTSICLGARHRQGHGRALRRVQWYGWLQRRVLLQRCGWARRHLPRCRLLQQAYGAAQCRVPWCQAAYNGTARPSTSEGTAESRAAYNGTAGRGAS